MKMSKKSVREDGFRKLTVSPYSDEEPDDPEPGSAEETGPNEGEVQALLSQNRTFDALKLVLNSPPVNTKNQATKDRAVQLVMRVMLSFKASEIEQTVKSLDQQGLDVLMKYIYRGFEFPSDGSSAQLLTWHEKAFAVGGLGSIVRVLTDRKKV
jgi:actin related protein 2/3 complex subunit 5